MDVDAFLCDAASVREGLLHVLGAGVTRIWREQYPAPLLIQLAMMITLRPIEAKQPRKLVVLIQDLDGGKVAELSCEFGLTQTPEGLSPGEAMIVPLVFDLRNLSVERAGSYSLEIMIDGKLTRSMSFAAGIPPKQNPPV